MKKFTSGLLAGVLIASAVPVIASNGRMIQVFDNVKRIVVDKVEKPFDKNAAPFICNGTTYVPLRFVADALGEDVNWDGKTGTVFIGETNNNNDYWGKDIEHMSWENYYGKLEYSFGDFKKVKKDNVGNEYSNYLTLRTGYYGSQYFSHVEFPLNGKYSKFNAILAPTQDSRDVSGSIDFRIFVDDKEVYRDSIENGDMPEDINIDISGANKITFRTESIDNDGRFYLGLFDGEFIK